MQAQLDSFFTAVLATVHAGAWRLDWIAGLLFLPVQRPRCNQLTLLAIKGGDACDCEIKSTEALMRAAWRGEETCSEVEDMGSASIGAGTSSGMGRGGLRRVSQAVPEGGVCRCDDAQARRIVAGESGARRRPSSRRSERTEEHG